MRREDLREGMEVMIAPSIPRDYWVEYGVVLKRGDDWYYRSNAAYGGGSGDLIDDKFLDKLSEKECPFCGKKW